MAVHTVKQCRQRDEIALPPIWRQVRLAMMHKERFQFNDDI